MEIKVQQVQALTQAPQETQVKQSENPFQFILESKVDDEGLAARLSSMYESITMEGKHLAQKKDIREMQRYRILIKDILFGAKIIWIKRGAIAFMASSASSMRTWMSWRRN